MKNFKKKNSVTLTNSPNRSTQRSIGSILREAAKQNDSEGETTSENMYRKNQRPSSIRSVLPLDKIKQRIPDTEHLKRMRALLVAAHTNDAFIKKLSEGNSYVPMNLDPDGSKEMGPSFSQVYKKGSARLKKQLDKADADAEEESHNPEAIEALIRGDAFKSQTAIIDEFDSDDDSAFAVEAEDVDGGESPSRLKKQFSSTAPQSEDKNEP